MAILAGLFLVAAIILDIFAAIQSKDAEVFAVFAAVLTILAGILIIIVLIVNYTSEQAAQKASAQTSANILSLLGTNPQIN